jgi:hypothetical protein
MGLLRVLTAAAILLCWALPLQAQRPLRRQPLLAEPVPDEKPVPDEESDEQPVIDEQPVPVQRRRDQPPVDLQFDAGRVTLSARNVPVRAILTEWARLGGATIVNGDRVGGPPVTIELDEVPERQALDILLRSVAGYMLAPRRTESDGASAFDRILILADSAAPRNPPPPAVAAAPPTLRRPPVIGPGRGAAGRGGFDPFGNQGAQVVNPPRGPGGGPVRQPLVAPQPPSPSGVVLFDPDTPPNEAPAPVAPAGTAATPSNPFGIPLGSSDRPGVISPVPEPEQ